jgi:hypothetical protein
MDRVEALKKPGGNAALVDCIAASVWAKLQDFLCKERLDKKPGCVKICPPEKPIPVEVVNWPPGLFIGAPRPLPDLGPLPIPAPGRPGLLPLPDLGGLPIAQPRQCYASTWYCDPMSPFRDVAICAELARGHIREGIDRSKIHPIGCQGGAVPGKVLTEKVLTELPGGAAAIGGDVAGQVASELAGQVATPQQKTAAPRIVLTSMAVAAGQVRQILPYNESRASLFFVGNSGGTVEVSPISGFLSGQGHTLTSGQSLQISAVLMGDLARSAWYARTSGPAVPANVMESFNV